MSDPYCLVRKYPNKLYAGNVHALVRAIVYLTNAPLSVYPVTNGTSYFLVIVGSEPKELVKVKLHNALVNGKPVTLKASVIEEFFTRRLRELKGEEHVRATPN